MSEKFFEEKVQAMAHPELHYVLESGDPKGRGTAVTLALGHTAPPLRFGNDRPYVVTGRHYQFCLSGLALPAYSLVKLLLNGDVIASRPLREELAETEALILLPGSNLDPFDDVIGLLTLEVNITLPRTERVAHDDDVEEGAATWPQEMGADSIEAIPIVEPQEAPLLTASTVPADAAKTGEAIEVEPSELTFYSEPLELRIPEGPVARNLDAMAERVRSESALFLAPESAKASRHASRAGGVERSLDIWEAFLEQLEPLVDRIRRHPKFRLTERERLDSPSRARSFTAKTARFIAEHPDELVPAAGASGLTIPGAGAIARGLTPRRILVESTGFSLDIPEHRVILAFLVRLEKAAESECSAIEALLTKLASTLNPLPEKERNNPASVTQSATSRASSSAHGLRSTSSAVLAPVLARMEEAALRARHLVDRIRKLARTCATSLGLSAAEVLRLAASPEGALQPTRLFLTPGSYRQIFECMTGWHTPEAALAEERLLMEGMRRSHLYEQFVLIELISAVRGLGFSLTQTNHIDYAGAGESYIPVDHANVFTFERARAEGAQEPLEEEGKEEALCLTLWYQPVISGGEHAGEGGIGLMRVTRYSLSPTGGVDGASALNSEPSKTPYYTPDFLLCVEKRGRRRWIILDAKYSSPKTVFRYKTPDLIFKYLFSVRAITPQDQVEGLWLLCGNGVSRSENFLSLLESSGEGFIQTPGLWVERCDAMVHPQNFIEGLRRVLASAVH